MSRPNVKRASADEQLELLTKGCVTVVRPEDLHRKLERGLSTGKPLVVKAGFDPSSPDIHLGHTVLLRKLRAFQQLGHEVHFVVGDFTAMIGDPSGKSKTRPELSREQVAANAETYKAQAFKVLDGEATRIDFNGSWLSSLGAEGLIRLAARATLAQLLEREDFKSRLSKGAPISLHELLYPLCQAYDSVALRADVELGGTDQTWNLLMGRDVMREHGIEPQVVMTVPILPGLDGVEKMSKSLGNAIGVTEPPSQMFGMTMSISDEMMWQYLSLLTDASPADVVALKADVASGRRHPMEAKKDLAERIAADFHGSEAARRARLAFEQQFQRREAPAEMPETVLSRSALPVDLVSLMAQAGVAASKSEARRLIAARAVDLDGAAIVDPRATIAPGAPPTMVLRVGKRGYLRLRLVSP